MSFLMFSSKSLAHLPVKKQFFFYLEFRPDELLLDVFVGIFGAFAGEKQFVGAADFHVRHRVPFVDLLLQPIMHVSISDCVNTSASWVNARV